MKTDSPNNSSSQCRDILQALQSGRRLTALEALTQFGCLNLKGRIFDLRLQGHAIQKKMERIESPNNRRGKFVARYFIVKEATA